MKIIVAVDKKWGIGKNNDLLFRLPADMWHFKEHTLGKTIVMGHNTLKSFPGGKPLKNRVNIVLGAQKDAAAENGYIAAASLDELFEILKGYNTDDVYVAGGAMVYKTLLPYCTNAVITKVDADGGAQLFFENLDLHKDWELISQGEEFLDGEHMIRFCEYKNKKVLKKF